MQNTVFLHYIIFENDLLQVAAHIEADLGVTVKEVSFPQLKYSFQIWDTFLALPDKDGKVCSALSYLIFINIINLTGLTLLDGNKT